MHITALALVLLLGQMPAGRTHEEHVKQMQHDQDMKMHGDQAMGFDQDAATHHFRVTDDGGAIEVTAKNAADAKTIDAIRAHLTMIAGAFADGDFSKPMMTHGEEPDGVAAMTRLRAEIRYTYEEIPSGGRVRIVTHDADALKAVHEFLAYQIREHHTGDPGR
jgi:hypothetical protein